uniref:Putative ovule protein n=1 Tax=Solanum chacoense TaxID=4108 RepID=A0A0V0GN99_SOLCH
MSSHYFLFKASSHYYCSHAYFPVFKPVSFCWVIVTIEELGISSVVYWKIHEPGFFDCKCVMTCANLEKTRVGQYVMILDYDWTLLGSLKNNLFHFSFLF